MINRILIVGDVGRGKTEFGKKFSEVLNIPLYSTDSYYWKKKYTQKESVSRSAKQLLKIYKQESWIVEGSAHHLLIHGLSRADVIIYMRFRNIIEQWTALAKRNMWRKDENIFDLFKMMQRVFFERYKLGNKRHELSWEELLRAQEGKVVIVSSQEEESQYLKEWIKNKQ